MIFETALLNATLFSAPNEMTLCEKLLDLLHDAVMSLSYVDQTCYGIWDILNEIMH